MGDAYDAYKRRREEQERIRAEAYHRAINTGLSRFDLSVKPYPVDDTPNPYWRNGRNARPDITEADLRRMAYGPQIKYGAEAIDEMTKATRCVFANHKEKREMAIYKYKNAEGKEVYGKRLVIDGTQWVMKEVGTGTIYAISPKAATEVLPYTVGVRFYNNNTIYHYFAKEGELSVGDLVWNAASSGTICEVVEVDTKRKSATKPLTGWVLSGKKLTEADVENGD